MSEQLTDWFPADMPPARPGVYQQMCGNDVELGYQHWNGYAWGTWHKNAESAARYPGHHLAYSTKWRGLACNPNATDGDSQTDDHTGICEVTE